MEIDGRAAMVKQKSRSRRTETPQDVEKTASEGKGQHLCRNACKNETGGNGEMKKYAIAAFLAILVAVMIAFPPTGEPAQKISVPVTVYQGDTLSSICIDLAEKYGDSRDWREIVYYAKEQNNIGKYIQPGDKLIIELVVNENNR